MTSSCASPLMRYEKKKKKKKKKKKEANLKQKTKKKTVAKNKKKNQEPKKRTTFTLPTLLNACKAGLRGCEIRQRRQDRRSRMNILHACACPLKFPPIFILVLPVVSAGHPVKRSNGQAAFLARGSRGAA